MPAAAAWCPYRVHPQIRESQVRYVTSKQHPSAAYLTYPEFPLARGWSAVGEYRHGHVLTAMHWNQATLASTGANGSGAPTGAKRPKYPSLQ